MGIVNIVKTVKQVHKESIVLVKTGKFFNIYGKDAFIISYLFGYKIRQTDEKIYMCGFPTSSIKKIMATLENKKIDYLILDRRNNYDVEEKSENKKQNRYNEIYTKAKKTVGITIRIQNINNYLMKTKEEEHIEKIIEKVEKVIYETGKI